QNVISSWRTSPRCKQLAEIRLSAMPDVIRWGMVNTAESSDGRLSFRFLAPICVAAVLGSCTFPYRSRGELPPALIAKATWYPSAKVRAPKFCIRWRLRPSMLYYGERIKCTPNVRIIGEVEETDY